MSAPSTQQENRVFPPPAQFVKAARIGSREQYEKMYRESIDQPEKFWGKIAEELHWFAKPTQVLEWKTPQARWFANGKTNISYNCLDRQIELGRGDTGATIPRRKSRLDRGLCRAAQARRRYLPRFCRVVVSERLSAHHFLCQAAAWYPAHDFGDSGGLRLGSNQSLCARY